MKLTPFHKSFGCFIVCALMAAGFEIAKVTPFAFVFIIFAIVFFVASVVNYIKMTSY